MAWCSVFERQFLRVNVRVCVCACVGVGVSVSLLGVRLYGWVRVCVCVLERGVCVKRESE